MQHKIQELYKQVQNEKVLLKMNNVMNVSEEAMGHHNDTLKQELLVLQIQHENVKIWGDLYRERLDRIVVLQKESNNLQEQIQVVDKQLLIRKTDIHNSWKLRRKSCWHKVTSRLKHILRSTKSF